MAPPTFARLPSTSLRTRRLATTSFFLATFCFSILTVSLSDSPARLLPPCPARRGAASRGILAQQQQQEAEDGQADHDDDELQSSATGRTVRYGSTAMASDAENPGVGQRVVLPKTGGWIQIEMPRGK